MPIRTNRGRAAVYRRIWGAPLRSPRHLVVTVLVLVGLLTVIGLLLPRLVAQDGTLPAASTTSQTPTGTEDLQRPPPTRETRLTTTLTPTSAPPDPVAVATAGKWAAAWVNHPKGTTGEEWLARLRPYTTEEYLAVLRTVDPRNIPADKVTGKPAPVNSSDKQVDVRVTTDGPTLIITMIETADGWRVAQYTEG